MVSQTWNLKQQMLEAIQKKGGWVNCHAHFDKAFYITQDGLTKSGLDMEQKWLMSDDIKKNSTQNQIETRIKTALDILIQQGCKLTATFIDAYDAVGHRAIDAANKVKEEYKKKIKLLTITQPLGGLVDVEARKLYEEITAKADIAGGLPSKDRPNDKKNFEILFSIAKNLNKKLHVHIDQENNPKEQDTATLIEFAKKQNYGDKTVAIHVLSVSAQNKSYRQKIYKEMAEIGLNVIVCPSAGLGMKQLDEYLASVHNSIANVPEMLEAGITVGLGVDNVYDFYQPFVDADMWTEMRLLQEACRYYNFDQLVEIATANGRKILET